MSRFSNTCLALIVLFLSMIVLRPILTPPSAVAAHRYKYTVAPIQNAHEIGKPCPQCSAQGLLDKYSVDGWEFVGLAPDGQFIFRK